MIDPHDRPQPVLLLSTGRTGTMFLAHFLSATSTNAAVYHETAYSRLMVILTNAHFAGLFPRQGLLAAWRRLKGSELPDCRADFFIDSNNHLYGLAVIAPELYPDLKVVHVVRDPRTYVPSHLNWTRHRLKSFVANSLVPFWQPNPWLVGEMSPGDWLRLSRFDSFCWIWTFKNRMLGSLQGSSVPYLRVHFEDLFGKADPGQTVNQLRRFIGLETLDDFGQYFRQPVNKAKRRSFPSWESWRPALCARLEAFCGELMSAYGYGRERDWIEKVAEGQALLAQKAR